MAETIAMDTRHADSAAVVSLLTQLYTDPVASAVRECASNAIDAVRRAGEEPGAASVRAGYDAASGRFWVQDAGCGMDRQTLRDTFLSYVNSDKGAESCSIGAFGLGAKAPLACADELLVETRGPSGQGLRALARREADGGATASLEEAEPPFEGSGTRVSFPLPAADGARAERVWRSMARLASRCGTAALDPEAGEAPQVGALDDGRPVRLLCDAEDGRRWCWARLRKWLRGESQTPVAAAVGGWLYPLSGEAWNADEGEGGPWLVVGALPGELHFVPSRDTVVVGAEADALGRRVRAAGRACAGSPEALGALAHRLGEAFGRGDDAWAAERLVHASTPRPGEVHLTAEASSLCRREPFGDAEPVLSLDGLSVFGVPWDRACSGTRAAAFFHGERADLHPLLADPSREGSALVSAGADGPAWFQCRTTSGADGALSMGRPRRVPDRPRAPRRGKESGPQRAPFDPADDLPVLIAASILANRGPNYRRAVVWDCSGSSVRDARARAGAWESDDRGGGRTCHLVVNGRPDPDELAALERAFDSVSLRRAERARRASPRDIDPARAMAELAEGCVAMDAHPDVAAYLRGRSRIEERRARPSEPALPRRAILVTSGADEDKRGSMARYALIALEACGLVPAGVEEVLVPLRRSLLTKARLAALAEGGCAVLWSCDPNVPGDPACQRALSTDDGGRLRLEAEPPAAMAPALRHLAHQRLYEGLFKGLRDLGLDPIGSPNREAVIEAACRLLSGGRFGAPDEPPSLWRWGVTAEAVRALSLPLPGPAALGEEGRRIQLLRDCCALWGAELAARCVQVRRDAVGPDVRDRLSWLARDAGLDEAAGYLDAGMPLADVAAGMALGREARADG